MYANIDEIDTKTCNVPYDMREEIDLWLLSKYNKLVKDVRESFDEYDLNKVVHYLSSFVSEDLSNWYIRRNRNRFWGSTLDNSKKSVYITTYEVLIGLSKLMAPVTPFLSEELYRNLTGEKSVHLTDYPTCNDALINEHIEAKMDLVRNLISIGRYVREETKIKVRQPLSEALLDGKNKELISDLVPLIAEELNIKSVTFVEDLNEYMNLSVKPNFQVVGKVFGSLIKEFQTKLENLTEEEISNLQKGNSIVLELGGEQKEITSEMVDIRISSKEGFNVGMENNNFIILNTELTEELVMEGIARETISKVQNIRKNKEFDIVDRINLFYNGDEEFVQALNKYMDYIKSETLAVEIIQKENLTDKFDLNGHEVYLDIEKNN